MGFSPLSTRTLVLCFLAKREADAEATKLFATPGTGTTPCIGIVATYLGER
jgi:hypothetical protein